MTSQLKAFIDMALAISIMNSALMRRLDIKDCLKSVNGRDCLK